MAQPGEIIAHPVTGEQITFLKTAAETNGELLQVEMNVAPRGFIPGEHIHPYQAEYFKILAGTISFKIDGHESQLGAGQELTVQAGTRHQWWNASDEPAKMILEFRPALQMAEFFETFWGVAQDGNVDLRTGLPNLLWLAIIFGKYHREIRGTMAPWPAQRILFSLLAPIAWLLGYRAPYPYPHARQRSTEPAALAIRHDAQ
jgi:quercetin dioxygenase-like cupin family protein